MGHISTQRRNGTVVGYSVYLGVNHEGLKQRRFFKHLSDAETFQRTHDANPLHVGELFERKTELLYCLDRLKSVGVSLVEVVDFFMLHRANKGNPTLTELVASFSEEKKRVGRSHHYDLSMKYSLGSFMDYVGKDKRVGDITRQQIADYVYNKEVGDVTKNGILTHLSVLFNFAIREDYLGVNPVEKISRPTIKFHKPHVLRPVDFEKLLNRCLESGWKDRLAIFALVGFCGIRTEEASRLKWSNINLEDKIVEVPADVAKKAQFRNNPIPQNALEWLRVVEDKRRTGPLIGSKWKTQLRSAIISAQIEYRQNSIRHSFCSYAIAAGWPLADVIAYMGHGGSPSMIHSHYRNVVSPEEGKRWFGIPCPLLRRHEGADPTAWLRSSQDFDARFGNKPRIVLAHGSVLNFASLPDDEESDVGAPNLIDLPRLSESAFDYIALGDWHGAKQVAGKAWYSGTPELDRFVKGEDHNPGNILVVKASRGHPREFYSTRDLRAHLATLGLDIGTRDMRRFCKRHGIKRDMRAGRPRKRTAAPAVAQAARPTRKRSVRKAG